MKIKKNTTQDKKKKLRRKCDRIYQEIGRMMYEKKGCLVCAGEYSCLHHFYPKSTCSALRYNIKNGIPICVKCHCRVHSSDDPTINLQIVEIRGKEWLEGLQSVKRNDYIKTSIKYYETVLKNLELIKPYKTCG